MPSRLKSINDWDKLAQEVNYNTKALAERCGISVRQLERLFLDAFCQTPHERLHALRLQRALELICDGCPVKQAADLLGYKRAEHLSHDFKKKYGVSPTRHVANMKQKSMPSPDMSRFDR